MLHALYMAPLFQNISVMLKIERKLKLFKNIMQENHTICDKIILDINMINTNVKLPKKQKSMVTLFFILVAS